MKVGYSKTFPNLVNGQWVKVWAEDEFTGTIEDARKVWYGIKKEVENFYYESTKADEKKAEKVVEQKIANDWANATPNEKVIAQINSFKEISGPNGLESFRLIVKGKKDLETAYNNRLKELT